MLLHSELKYKLGETYLKILDHCICYDNGLIISSIKRHRTYCLSHFDKTGKRRAELEWKDDGPESIQMPNNRTVMALFPCDNKIFIWNLEDHEHKYITFNFAIPENFCSTLFMFQDNNYMCIQENGPLGDNTFKLTYFQLPFTEESKPFIVF